MKCAPAESRRGLFKVGKKLMVCDGCNRSNGDTIIKIQMNQCKLEFNINGNVMKLKRADIEVP
jgi:hypothetical protein